MRSRWDTRRQALRLTLDLEELLATRLLVQGNSGSGKSHLLRRLLEQSAPWVQQTIIDPEGDFVALADRFGHLLIDAEDHTERGLQVAGERARIHRVSTVLNLEGLDAENQMRRAAAFLGGLFDVARDHWYPMLVVVDEAQLFAPAVAGEVSDEARKLSLGAMTNLMCRGRKRGLAGIIATQRLAKLAKNVAAEASNFLMGRTFLDIDMARAADLLGMERRQAEAFRDLERGQFMALGPALSRRPLGLRIGPTETTPRNATPRLMPLPEATLDARAIILAAPPPETNRPQRRSPPDLLGQLMAAKSAALEIRPEAVEQPLSAEELAERRERVDRILRAVMAEPDAGFRAIGVLYQEFVVRCRIEGLGSDVPDLADFRRMLTRARAGLGSDMAEDDGWQDVSVRASLLPEDMQGVFMMIARAAKEGWPCPGDAAIARAYGSHSLRRARRLLTYIEEQGLIVCQLDGAGRRIVTLVELAWATAPGDPNAEELPAEQGCSSSATVMIGAPARSAVYDSQSPERCATVPLTGPRSCAGRFCISRLRGVPSLSVAFTKEDSAETASETLLPDRPVSPHPNLVTEAGLKALEFQLHQAREAYETAQKIEDVNERRRQAATPLRDARYFAARVRTAQVVPNPTSTDTVAFGSTVTFRRDDGRVQKYHIVGEDEADPKAGSISFVSPVARSLMGKAVGDVVGTSGQELEIIAIS